MALPADDAPAKIPALWVGQYGCRLPDGTLLETGITVVEISTGEAHESDYWVPQIAGASVGTTTPAQPGEKE